MRVINKIVKICNWEYQKYAIKNIWDNVLQALLKELAKDAEKVIQTFNFKINTIQKTSTAQ